MRCIQKSKGHEWLLSQKWLYYTNKIIRLSQQFLVYKNERGGRSTNRERKKRGVEFKDEMRKKSGKEGQNCQWGGAWRDRWGVGKNAQIYDTLMKFIKK